MNFIFIFNREPIGDPDSSSGPEKNFSIKIKYTGSTHG